MTKTYRERKSKINRLIEDYNIIEPSDFDRLNSIISVLNKPGDKRVEKDLSLITPLLSKVDFFANKNKLSPIELEEVARNMKYEYKKPGETIFNSLDKADKFYIVLKGRVMLQIPALDNSDFGVVVKESKKDVKKEVLVEKEEDSNVKFSD